MVLGQKWEFGIRSEMSNVAELPVYVAYDFSLFLEKQQQALMQPAVLPLQKLHMEIEIQLQRHWEGQFTHGVSIGRENM